MMENALEIFGAMQQLGGEKGLAADPSSSLALTACNSFEELVTGKFYASTYAGEVCRSAWKF